MNRLRDKFIRFMYGRYGATADYLSDKLNRAILIAAIALIVIRIPFGFLPEGLGKSLTELGFSLAIVGLYAWFVFRLLSKNTYARRRENLVYLDLCRKLKQAFSFNISRGTKSGNRDDGFYVFRDCTKCGATLRLPRKSGMHSVKCPKCAHMFKVKVK